MEQKMAKFFTKVPHLQIRSSLGTGLGANVETVLEVFLGTADETSVRIVGDDDGSTKSVSTHGNSK